ncbi:MAG: PLDc N-terminal domain-containing protein [Lapillicoccus sp.]
MLRFVIPLLSLALTIYALVDCIQTPDDHVRHLPKLFWIILVILVQIIGPVAWLLAGRQRSGAPGRRPMTGPKGPEDDPDFLRGL